MKPKFILIRFLQNFTPEFPGVKMIANGPYDSVQEAEEAEKISLVSAPHVVIELLC